MTSRVHCKRKPYDVYCGRPSKYGNPWVIGEDGTRDEVCDRFEAWFPQQSELVADARRELKNKTLGCWCSEGQRCHCDTIIRVVDGEPMSEDISRQIAFLKALHGLQAELEGVVKDAKNPHFKSNYADRTDILLFIRPLLNKHGFVLTQALTTPPPHVTGDVLAMTTTLHHVDTGAAIGDTAIVPLPKSDPQGYGSAATYASRYGIVNLLALPLLDDDDGTAASHTGGKGGAGTFKKQQADAAPKPKEDKPAPKQDAGNADAGGAEKTTATSAASEKGDAKTTTATGKPTTRKLWGSK